MRRITIFIITALIATTTMAQKKETKNLAHEKRAERMATELSLTDSEKQQVQVLIEQQEAEYKSTKDKMKPSDPNYKQKLQDLHKKHEAQLEKLIGSEKMAKHKENSRQVLERIQSAKEKISSRISVN